MNKHWPEIPFDQWQETYESVHLWSQIIGKIRLAKMPWINHSWHVPLYLTARGLSTSIMHDDTVAFEIEFDFVAHQLTVRTTRGESKSFPLRPMSVADFYDQTKKLLTSLDITMDIYPLPVELPDPIQPFPENKKPGAYDADAVYRFWQALVQMHRVFTQFRADFIGKVSPIHFFWGAFDLAVTRFSGRSAPKHPGGAPNVADWVMVEAYSHEVSSAGFWPGAGMGEASFYSYAYPEPDGFRDQEVLPEAAYYDKELGEFVLPYEVVRTAVDPDKTLLQFLQTTYDAAANLANWNRDTLESKFDQLKGDE